MSSKSVTKAMAQLGKVTMAQVKEANKGTGDMWLSALDIAQQTVKMDYPSITGIQIAGARAHQSHKIQSHSNVISAKFFVEDQRVISGHIHINGSVDYSKEARDGRASSSQQQRWQPTRDQVDSQKWTIYDPEKKKKRAVKSEGDWWYIEKGGDKVWF